AAIRASRDDENPSASGSLTDAGSYARAALTKQSINIVARRMCRGFIEHPFPTRRTDTDRANLGLSQVCSRRAWHRSRPRSSPVRLRDLLCANAQAGLGQFVQGVRIVVRVRAPQLT